MSDLRQPRERFREIARAKLADDRRPGRDRELDRAPALHRLDAWGELPRRRGAAPARARHPHGGGPRHRPLPGGVHGGRSRPAAATSRSARRRRRRAHTSSRSAGAASAKLVAKSKSMATEEIRLNEALEAAGIRPVETDLGEYILQLAGEHPVHIVAPGDREDEGGRRRALQPGRGTGGRRPSCEALTRRRAASCARCSSTPTSGSPAPTSSSPRPARSSRSRTRATAASSPRCRRCTSRSPGSSGSCRRSPTSAPLLAAARPQRARASG